MAELRALTALGHEAPLSVTLGALRLVERADVALASLACRAGCDEAFARAASAAGVPLPDTARWREASPYAAFWVAPQMWFVEAPFDSREHIADHLKHTFGKSASITEQTDAWVRFDLTHPAPARLIERLCNVDLPTRPDGFATRTVIDHLGCYLIWRSATEGTLYGPRSSARSLLHTVEVAAAAIA